MRTTDSWASISKTHPGNPSTNNTRIRLIAFLIFFFKALLIYCWAWSESLPIPARPLSPPGSGQRLSPDWIIIPEMAQIEKRTWIEGHHSKVSVTYGRALSEVERTAFTATSMSLCLVTLRFGRNTVYLRQRRRLPRRRAWEPGLLSKPYWFQTILRIDDSSHNILKT